jgi:hypothetical protein
MGSSTWSDALDGLGIAGAMQGITRRSGDGPMVGFAAAARHVGEVLRPSALEERSPTRAELPPSPAHGRLPSAVARINGRYEASVYVTAAPLSSRIQDSSSV